MSAPAFTPKPLYDHERRYQAMRDAAPELYEALSEMVGLYGTCAELEECAACSKAIAALAKARGDAK